MQKFIKNKNHDLNFIFIINKDQFVVILFLFGTDIVLFSYIHTYTSKQTGIFYRGTVILLVANFKTGLIPGIKLS